MHLREVEREDACGVGERTDMNDYRAVLLVDCPTEADLLVAKELIARLVAYIETESDGATVQLFGLTAEVRVQDIHYTS